MVRLVVLPYFPGLTEKLKRYLTAQNIRTAVKPQQKKCDILQTYKDPGSPSKCQGTTCNIPCKNCPLLFLAETSDLCLPGASNT